MSTNIFSSFGDSFPFWFLPLRPLSLNVCVLCSLICCSTLLPQPPFFFSQPWAMCLHLASKSRWASQKKGSRGEKQYTDRLRELN